MQNPNEYRLIVSGCEQFSDMSHLQHVLNDWAQKLKPGATLAVLADGSSHVGQMALSIAETEGWRRYSFKPDGNKPAMAALYATNERMAAIAHALLICGRDTSGALTHLLGAAHFRSLNVSWLDGEARAA